MFEAMDVKLHSRAAPFVCLHTFQKESDQVHDSSPAAPGIRAVFAQLARLCLTARRRPSIRATPGWETGETKLHPQRSRGLKPTKLNRGRP